MTRRVEAQLSAPRISKARGSDRGSATILGVAAGLTVALLGLVVAMAATNLIDRAKAQTAADFGALAGAGWARAGQEVACARAAKFVSDNHAILVSCIVEGLDVTVTAEVNGDRAVARAGPTRTAVGGSDAV